MCRTAGRRLRLFLAGFALCLASGCYEMSFQGDATFYTFATWVRLLVLVVGLVGVPVGWLLRRWSDRLGFVLMVLSPILLVLIVPGLFADQVVVDGEHFEGRYGFWFAPTVFNVRFDELREIRYVAVQGNRGRTNYELHCYPRQGDMVTVHAGDLVRNAVPEILSQAQRRGVPVLTPP